MDYLRGIGSEPKLALTVAIAVIVGLTSTGHSGDILRGGAGGSSQAGGKAPVSANPAVVDQARVNGKDALARTTQTVQAMQALQKAAREIAQKGVSRAGANLPTVPDGLGRGGLQVAPGVATNSALWRGASLPQQTSKDGGVNVVVKQNSPQAILNWESFNVGKKTSLKFDQSAGGKDQRKWAAFNKVEDPSGVPSQILGKLEAPGQVYVINRNGVVFGGSSVVNVNTLTASSLPINDNLIARGLLNNPDAQFLFSALPLAAGGNGTPAFNPTISDPSFRLASGTNSYTLAEQVAINGSNAPLREVEFVAVAANGARTRLIAGTDYTFNVASETRKGTATFTAEGLTKIGGNTVSATYTPVVVKPGNIVVQPGARISSPVNAEGNGGRIMLVGGNVMNRGTLSAPAGQTILAAGLQVGLDAHRSSDPSLRGLDVYVGQVKVPAATPNTTTPDATLPPTPVVSTGTVTNGGLIEAARGNATLIGSRVEQLSVIESSTSTALNGRIDVLADYGATPNLNYDVTKPSRGAIFINRATGTVEIGEDSVTRILPELNGADRAIGSKLALASQVNIQGKAIHFAENAEILAPNANVTINAGNWGNVGSAATGSLTAFKFTGGQIYFDAGATIDVSGSIDVPAAITENILSLQLRGAELAGSPLQRDGVLRGPTIYVDARRSGTWNGFSWVGTPLGDVSGYLGIIEHTVGQLTVAGGTVNLNAGESVVMRAGSKIDVSGGWLNYEGGMVNTTRVLSSGVLVDLASATPDRVYDGIYTGTTSFTSAKYGITETFAHPLALSGEHYEQSYIQGANAGSITIIAPAQALDGTLLGRAVQGPRQQNSTTMALAQAGALNLQFQADEYNGQAYFFKSPTPPELTFSAMGVSPAPASFAVRADGTPEELSEERKKKVFLSPELLTTSGFGTLSIDNGDGRISIPEETMLRTPIGGSISLRAANVDIAGDVIAPGGSLSFTVHNFSPFELARLKTVTTAKVTPAPTPERGIFTLASTAKLSTAGLVTDCRPRGTPVNQPPLVNGGSITINAFTANLAMGSEIDVSGGVSISASGERTYGTGGSIVVNAGNEPEFAQLLGGRLVLDAALKGYSGTRGGSLTVQAPMVQVGGPRPVLQPLPAGSGVAAEPFYLFGETKVGRDELLYLTPGFFRRGGFANYTINGIGKAISAINNEFLPAITIAPGAVIEPIAESLLAVPGIEPGAVGLQRYLKPEGLRAPVSLTFGSSPINDNFPNPAVNAMRGDIVMGEGSKIQTDPRGSVTLQGSTVAVLGSIVVPGGNITISGGSRFTSFNPSDVNYKKALPTVHIGPRSVLSTAGRTVLTPDPYGRRIGTVLPGGNITVSGNIVAEAGALLDVSGTSGILELPALSLSQNIAEAERFRLISANSGLNAPLQQIETVATRVDSDAGSLTLRGSQELFSDATLRGFAGGPSARGGSLFISSGRFVDPDNTEDSVSPLDLNLIVTQTGLSIPTGFYPKGGTAIGHLVPVANGDPTVGRGRFVADTFLHGGFDSLSLSGNAPQGGVAFSGDVSITARRSLSVSDGGVIYADSAVELQAPYIALGMPFKTPVLPSQVGELGFAANFRVRPTFGPGTLTAHALLIDVGNLSLQNIGRVNLIAENGDIRGNGTLHAAGAITLQAGQVYPTTASQFTIVAYDPNISVYASSTSSTQVTLASAVLPPGFGVGSPLLGSKVAAIDGATVTLEANANTAITGSTLVTFAPGAGSVSVAGSGSRPLPLSAGGALSIYASNIHQAGTLRAPLGTINLGWDGTGTSPIDYLSGAGLQANNSVAITQRLTLAGGSITSISAVDPTSGLGLLLPYGINANGTSWIAPNGVDVTSGGLVNKGVNLVGLNVSHQAGALVDLQGGGDLYAYRWVSGLQGTVDYLGSASGAWDGGVAYKAGQLVSYKGSTWSARRGNTGTAPAVGLDWTLVPQRFAVIPDYEANYAPFAPFNNRVDALNLTAGDPGYSTAGLSVGDRVYLGASNGLAAGTYTLLPARYALLPGAVLVTPQSSPALGSIQLPGGSSLVSGYRFNDLNANQSVPVAATRFEVASDSVIRARAQYDDSFANAFFTASAKDLGINTPRLPLDSGKLLFSGANSLRIEGNVGGRSTAGGHDAQVDVSSLADIYVTGSGGTGPSGSVVLKASKLNSFGAESLLIGGQREIGVNGTTIAVKSGKVTVDNAGSPLVGPEIILVANNGLTLAAGAAILQSGSTGGSNDGASGVIRIGDSAVAGSGNGLLLRVSDQQVAVVRSGNTSLTAQGALANPPVMTIGAGARVSGAALTLDSTYGTSLDPSARIQGQNLALNSGQISIQFDNAGTVPVIAGLMLDGVALQGLQSAQTLSLLSYSSIDLYGTGSFTVGGSLALHTGEIRGFNSGGGSVTFAAGQISLDNLAGGNGPGSSGVLEGGLVFDAGVIRLGSGAVKLDQFATVDFQATGGLLTAGTGNVATQGALTITAPVIVGGKASNYQVSAGGALELLAPNGGGTESVSGGLGASLAFTGASVLADTDILLPSGSLTLRATTGNLEVESGTINVGGTEKFFNDLVGYTNGGRITLVADAGSVILEAESDLSVAARPGGGNAGTVAISAANGTVSLQGSLDGRGGLGGKSGTFALDVSVLPDVSPLDQLLNESFFTESRDYRIRTGDVTVSGLATAHLYRLSADQGSIVVAGQGNIDASGVTGGDIRLIAFGGVTLQDGARLSVAAERFDSAGKGGYVSLESGSQRNGVVGNGFVDLQAGSTIDLSVASVVGVTPEETTAKTAAAAALGQFTGKLHLRAPQNAAGTDLLVNPLDGTISGASSIMIEGYRLFDLTNTSGTITNSGSINAAGGLMVTGNNIQGSINANAVNFLGAAGSTTAGYTAMWNRLLGADPQGLGSVVVLAPGAEVIHRTGNLTLGTPTADQNSDWNLSTFRYGEKRAAGTLTLRAAGNLVFNNAISDGFTLDPAVTLAQRMYRAELSAYNAALPANTQSWSYRFTAGSDFTAADYNLVRPLASLAANAGSLQLGRVITTNNGIPVASTSGGNAQTSTALAGRFQVIRTGSGDIEISAGRDVQLLNQFASIYTAGTRVADPTLGGNFETPPSVFLSPTSGPVGAPQQNPTYTAQYSMAGGNVRISAQQDIKHQTQSGGVLVADSQKQIPNNWLYRRGYVDATTGEFGAGVNGDIASTTWWVDFSNFFQGTGALGGGNVTLIAGNDVSNVDAVAPTNARMTYQTVTGDRVASNQTLIELGGGDVTISAGRNIDAGIYYVERGRGTLSAGNSIITNSTRSASLGPLTTPASIEPSPTQWLPTTLFLGKGGYDISAGNDVLLGPVVNPFLLPVGINNAYTRKSYFSTYALTNDVNVSSLGGQITFRQNSTPFAAGVDPNNLPSDGPILRNWMQSIHLFNSQSLSNRQPWLRLAETSLLPFNTAFSMLPGTVRATAFSGDINLVGRFNLSPSPSGTIELAAAGAINGLQPSGAIRFSTGPLQTMWTSAKINLSDADPSLIPGIYTPFGYQGLVGLDESENIRTRSEFLVAVDNLFRESGSSSGEQAIIQVQQALHGTSLLHANDLEPVRIYAGAGDISGITLFSAKAARVIAGNDISDVSLYLQNNRESDISVVAAGRDIIAYNANTRLRIAAQSPANLVTPAEGPLAGDLQINGPGILQVLAGRNLDLGTGENNPDGTGVGLTSIGNARNPNLPSEGASIIAGAGLGPIADLASSFLGYDAFLEQVLAGPEGERYVAEIRAKRTDLPAIFASSSVSSLDAPLRAQLALEVFYLVLRDAGRNHNVEGSPGFGNYDSGFAAIATLFPDWQTEGNIETRSRDIRTRSGGSISLLAPGGGLQLAESTIGTPLAPPGVITEAGGAVSIFTHTDVDIGISRIFTLRGGDAVIWSSTGNIAAGSAAKTVQSAPPTRVLIDPQTAVVQTDLAGLATGGGIGVLATVAGIEPGSVDLIAPSGVIDAGDAGIRATGNLNVAAITVLNADNIQVTGASVGTPAPTVVATPNLGSLAAAAGATAAVNAAATEVANNKPQQSEEKKEEVPSIVTVEVLGYGGGE